MRVLALTKYGSLAASMRQRFLQYDPHLRAAGIEVDYKPLLGNAYLGDLLAGRKPSPLRAGGSYLRRIGTLAARPAPDVLWVHCELFPYWPAIAEVAGARLGSAPIVYDVDDAIFHMYDRHPNRLVRTVLGNKLKPLLRRSAISCCGNDYIRDYAALYCPRTMVLPTVVDTRAYAPAPRSPGRPVTIGWIGSPSTWIYMRPLLPLLESLSRELGVLVSVVGAGAAAQPDRFEGLRLVDWSEENEIADVQAMDIGIMPLPDEPWARGKSGYKLIQYMACGLPVVASPVGVNASIVAQGQNGLLASTTAEWESALRTLVGNAELRSRMGAMGRERAVSDYSLQSQAPHMIEALRYAAATRSQ